jgi:hypothetical protein
MIPGKYNTTIRQGDTWTETFTVTDSILTGYSAIMLWKNAAKVVKVTCSSLADPSTLTVEVGAEDTVLTPIITSAQTALLSAGKYYYALRLTSPGGIVETYLEGTITVVGSVLP